MLDREALRIELSRLLRLISSGELPPSCQEHGGLSIRGAWAPCALRPNGEVVIEDLEGVVTVQDDEPSIITAVVYLSAHYPSLAQLIPARPATASTCASCQGSGHFTVGSQVWPSTAC